MSKLLQPWTSRSVTAPNRIWASPMCLYSVFDHSGVPGAWQLVHLGSLATGGSGVVFTEATAVSPEGRISARDTGIWSDEQADAWRPITTFIAEQGAIPAIQLAHAGRKGSVWSHWRTAGRSGSMPPAEGGWQTVSASDKPFTSYDRPAALTPDGIDRVVDDFRAAARRSIDAGFRIIEVHAAHGYLLHQFLSPLANHRDDEYGGTLENRARLLLRVVEAVRGEIGDDYPLFVRFSATDWVEGGWDLAQTGIAAGWARDTGADFFDVSSGGIDSGIQIPTSPGYQVHLAEQIRAQTGVSVSAVGLITELAHAAEIVDSGRVDAVMLARQLLRDPTFPHRAAKRFGSAVTAPPQYRDYAW